MGQLRATAATGRAQTASCSASDRRAAARGGWGAPQHQQWCCTAVRPRESVPTTAGTCRTAEHSMQLLAAQSCMLPLHHVRAIHCLDVLPGVVGACAKRHAAKLRLWTGQQDVRLARSRAQCTSTMLCCLDCGPTDVKGASICQAVQESGHV